MTAKCGRFGPDTAQFNAKLAINDRPVSTSWETGEDVPFHGLEVSADVDKLALAVYLLVRRDQQLST